MQEPIGSTNRRRLVAPTFESNAEYLSCHGDLNFWWPYVDEILKRHNLSDSRLESVAGVGGTYPTFMYGDFVVKLFGHIPWWHKDYAAERGVQVLFDQEREIAGPRLISDGQLFNDDTAPWPYLVTVRMPGVCWHDARLSSDQRLRVAADLGRQLRRVHALRPLGVQTDEVWPILSFREAAERISFPPHLVAQIDGYLGQLGPFDRVLVHGDLFSRHPFVKDGRLTGIIDWGDAVVTDRHYELAKLHLDTFECDKSLLRVFLHESAWPVDKDFPRQALGLALYRQAVHFARGSSGDVFYLVKNLLPLDDIGTLDELANELFAI